MIDKYRTILSSAVRDSTSRDQTARFLSMTFSKTAIRQRN